MEGVSQKEKPEVLKFIQWILFAIRPLSLDELRFAMAIDPDSPYKSLQECHDSGIITDSNDEMKRKVKCLSFGLAEIREHHHTEIVQFIHQSVNDFLIDDGLKILLGNSWQSMSLAIGSAHHQLSRSCIRYIDMKEIRQWESEGWDERTKFPFLEYATKSWLLHAEIAHSKGISAGDLLNYFHWPSNDLIGLWVKTYRMLDRFSDSCPPKGTSYNSHAHCSKVWSN